MRNSIVVFLFAVSATLSGIQGVAGVIPPVGLAPGSQYQLIFVTFDTTAATSSDINDYNAFVTAEAASYTGTGAFGPGLPAGLTWHAVASTATVDARDNAPSHGLPVYNTAGQLVAASSIYSGSLLAAVRYDEIGLAYHLENAAVWTGSDATGVGILGHTLGDAGGNAVTGFAGGSSSLWMEDHDDIPVSNAWALYALSSPTTVPTPEPASLALLGSALLLLGGFRFLRTRRARP